MQLLKDFRDFAVKGNVVDLAVGVIIGTSFGKIVSSLVADVAMPTIGVLSGGVDFSALSYVAHNPLTNMSVTIQYGQFLQSVFDFLVVAVSVFAFVTLSKAMLRKKPATAPEPEKPADILLLEEIRDFLKHGAKPVAASSVEAPKRKRGRPRKTAEKPA